MRVSPVNTQYDSPQQETPRVPRVPKQAFIVPETTRYAQASNPYYQLPDLERAKLLCRYHNGQLIDRIYIQNYLLRSCPEYLKNENSDSQRRFLGRQYKCDCSDCDGPDVSRDCLVEEAFYEQTGLETPQEIISNYSSPEPSPLVSGSQSENSIDYEEPDVVENVSQLLNINTRRISLTYQDIQRIMETEVNL